MSQEASTTHPDAHYAAHPGTDGLRMTLAGQLDAANVTAIWDGVLDTVYDTPQALITVDLDAITYMDGAGVALLLKMKEEAALKPASLQLINVRAEHQNIIDLAWETDFPPWTPKNKERRGFFASVGAATQDILISTRDTLSFVGESAILLAQAARHPSQIRWKDVVLSCVNVGVNSLFIICLIGFLMGLIMSFQSAVTLKQFGGEIYIPNMLGVVMFREMGPLVTAILLAARSGSAFAAEIGTMKINEELDALTTMGLSPMRFMVVPKLISTMFMIPLMTLFFIAASLVGGALVMLSLGFPLVTFTSRIFAYVGPVDFFGGMVKAFVFAMLVSGIGCLRGMQTREGASAVGQSTTSAVVSGIILIAFADGMFAVTFYYLGW